MKTQNYPTADSEAAKTDSRFNLGLNSIQPTGVQFNDFLTSLGEYALGSVKRFAKSEYDSCIGTKANRVKAKLDELDSSAKYIYKILQDPSIAWADISDYLIRWALGNPNKEPEEYDDMETARHVLSDGFENELRADGKFKVVSQEELRKVSKGKYGGKKIFALYVEGEDAVYMDSEVEKDEGMKYRALLHEALEKSSHRNDHSNCEKEHVDIELNVSSSLEYAAKNFTGVLKGRAEKAKEAYYRTVHEGSEAGDDLFMAVKSKLKEALN